MEPSSTAGLLSPYRVLDLTGAECLLCGKILADLGADVIQVEPPHGHAARRIGPFYHNDVQHERSLYWWSYTSNKRSITLDITSPEGQAILKRLVCTADFLLESGPPGALAALGLGYEVLAAINPAIIMVSITPFGQEGPYAHYKTPDLIGMAMSGFMYVTGEPDRAPVRIGFPHFYLHGAGAGASGAMVAHMHRLHTGKGQLVDVSCQEAMARALANAPQSYTMEQAIIQRQGAYRQTGATSFMRLTWPCKDGYVNFQFSGGQGSGLGVNNLIRWMVEDGMGDAALEAVDFTTLGYGTITPEMLTWMVPPIERFLLSKTKQELFQGAIERRILMFPVSNAQDIVHDPQLAARQYFQQVAHPELEAPVTLLGPFASLSLTPLQMYRLPPPALGAHNQAIYHDELGLQPEELAMLRAQGVL
ncbi:MAG: CaiB/BaiF CoA transferase family protein [Candidatus Tectimicrobiota bacterium]